MKRLLLIVLPLLLFVGCSSTPEPINYETTLIERGGVYYTKDTNQPYSGPVFSLDDKGRNKKEGNLEDGKMNIYKELQWYDNGQKASEYKTVFGDPIYEKSWNEDGKKDGYWTSYYENSYLEQEWEKRYKDGKLISSKEWNKDGSVKE